MFGSPSASSPPVWTQLPVRTAPPFHAWRRQLRRASWPQYEGCRSSCSWYGPKIVVAVRICDTHSVRSAAPAERQLDSPTSSSNPSVFSHKRWPTSALRVSSTRPLEIPACTSPFVIVLSSVWTTVLFAQSASRFQRPHPPLFCRVYPFCE